MNKIFILSVVAVIVFSCGEEKKPKAYAPTPVATSDAASGEKVFNASCAICHGQDGKLGLNGAKDLSLSKLTVEERISQISNGKGQMPAQKDLLTAAEIKAAAEYTIEKFK